ncbi:MAG: molybdopterin cofactor-binding domain-containing protein [Dehalococcoidia bacterium]
MARKKQNAPIQWEYGKLVNPTPEQLEREAASKHLYGYDVIEQIQEGRAMPAPPAAPPSGPTNFKVVGVGMADIHATEMVTGRARYSSDHYPTGTLFAAVLRSPYPHAKVKTLDISEAVKLPGVMSVITYKDVPKIATRAVLTDEPSFVGEGIAAVAAIDEGTAEEAIRLIKVEYEQLPFVIDAREALKPGAPMVRSGMTTNANRDPQFSYKRGDVNAGFSQSDLVVDWKTTTQWEQHCAMEPHFVLAQWDRDDKLSIQTSSQYVHSMRNGIAAGLGMPQSRVRVISEFMGGGWGDKTGWYPYHIVAATLARRAGRPVRYELTRKDVFLEAGHNYPKYHELRLGFKRDGTLMAGQSKAWIASGAWGARANTDDVESMLRLYKCANWDVEGYAAATNTFVAGPLRSVGEPSGQLMIESLMNIAAEKLNMDPVELRLKNLEEAIDQVTNQPYSSCGIRETIVQGAAAFDWKNKWKGWQRQRDLTKPVRGVGMMAFAAAKGAKSAPMTAQCIIDPDGSVRILCGAGNIGSGQRTTFSMIASEVLGIPLSLISMSMPDTEFTTDTGVIAGSRGTKSVGSAVMAAAQDAKAKLLENAAGRMRVPVDDLDVVDGKIIQKSNPSNTLTIANAVASGTVVVDQQVFAVTTAIVGNVSLPPPAGYSQKTFGAGFFEIELDPGTGDIRVLNVVQAHDIGRVINPLAAENQVHGGVVQGMNKALTEEVIFDPATGIPVNTNLDDYKLHMINKAPQSIKAIFVETNDVLGPYGAKGLGEPANMPGLAAIANAIHDAIGTPMTQAPFTPYRVVKTIRQA